MKIVILLCVPAAFLAACSDRDIRLRGTLAEGWSEEPLFVSVAGASEPSEIQNGAFELSGIPAGPIDLRIETEDDEIARMRIHDLPPGATLSLQRIHLDEERDLAFPAAIRLEGAGRVAINGVHMADPEALPGRMEASGVVLALSDDTDALVVRPDNGDLPDLAVVITPATEVTDLSGEAISLDQLSAGDSLRVQGRVDSGYLYAQVLTLTRGANEAPSHSAPEGSTRGARASSRDRVSEKEEKEPKGRRDSDADRTRLPEGHRPPPGECRDWNPNLPPGQQPPPRKC